MEYLIGIDIGTTNAKTVIINENGKVISQETGSYALFTPSLNFAEHNPIDYWKAIKNTIKNALQKSSINPSRVLAIGISGLSPGCILVDINLNPLNRCHIWMDRRGEKESIFVKKRLGLKNILSTSINNPDPSFTGIKLLWEKRHHPGLYKRTYKCITPVDYIRLLLTGKLVTDLSNASMSGVIFNMRERCFDKSIVSEIGLDYNMLPEIVPCDFNIGGLEKKAAKQLGLLEGTPVIAGCIDSAAAWLSAGVIEDGDSCILMGTSGSISVLHSKPIFTKDMWICIPAINSEKMFATSGALSNCGSVINFCREILLDSPIKQKCRSKKNNYELLINETINSSLGSNGIICLPYLSGERSPIWDIYAKGAMVGFSNLSKRGDFIKSMMEGVAFAFLHNYSLIKSNGVDLTDPITIIEGGAENKIWRKIVCDVLGIRLAYYHENKGAPFGAALLAGIGIGIFNKNKKSINKIIGNPTIIVSNEKNHQVYLDIFRVYKKLYINLKKIFNDLYKIRNKYFSNN
jgi:ribulokinase